MRILKELILNYGGEQAEEGLSGRCGKRDQCGQRGKDFSGTLLFFLLPGRSIPADLQWYQKVLNARRKLDFDDMLL